jgi:hypothetical protein
MLKFVEGLLKFVEGLLKKISTSRCKRMKDLSGLLNMLKYIKNSNNISIYYNIIIKVYKYMLNRAQARAPQKSSTYSTNHLSLIDATHTCKLRLQHTFNKLNKPQWLQQVGLLKAGPGDLMAANQELEQNFQPPPKRENTETERRVWWGALRHSKR